MGVQGVSYPRSGHGLLAEFLIRYFGPSFSYCEYYGHCRQAPCANPHNHFQKNHDFGLALPVPRDRPLLIQYRNPLYSIASNFALITVIAHLGRGCVPSVRFGVAAFAA